MIHIDLTDQPIDVAAALRSVEADGAGAINTFIGTVRNQSTGRPVVRLEYEAYDSMALHQLRKVTEQAAERWPMVQKITVVHRKGTLYIGDVAVVVAVSTPHRAESFAACQYIIDTLKQVVTIWKKEFYQDGDVWVAAHP
ncbi:molybdenum cofactor biosynthesis protein MoaE [Microvirga sp. STR05]|uniref:Molybdopterin synthase catalytic subunit n=1 Tax=Hymenobacter duratus TaxID=2771356 RepID=A0ABR8JMY8_9BACT|nr:molybdenum cofactor biosynthesis protein MoaE [Hymenobacter duratus]MBD2717086.1 molybdenum cofactor biosynthesis protein MoaE [Hymenobacter duratus]MBR7952002.1 molybdenum cofactor biosynthesis protein MoaE [Microvirga sp. STR05]